MSSSTFQSFLPFQNIVHGISSNRNGSMKRLDDKQIDRKAIQNFASSLGISDKVVCMKQIHSGTVAIVEDTEKLIIPETDGLVTKQKNISLAILTADCLPILLYDPEKEVIGVAHAGYKGLLNHVIEHTIQKFVSVFHSDPKDIIVGIGPSIERDCYEVGVELIEKFQEEFPSFEDIFTEKDQKFFLDLRGIALQCLLKEGIVKEHVEIMDICTKDDSNFYSYRDGDGDKRFVSLISLV